MREQEIIITINEDGSIKAVTHGFQGPTCIEELEKFLKDAPPFKKIVKTDDYYKDAKININTKTNAKIKRNR